MSNTAYQFLSRTWALNQPVVSNYHSKPYKRSKAEVSIKSQSQSQSQSSVLNTHNHNISTKYPPIVESISHKEIESTMKLNQSFILSLVLLLSVFYELGFSSREGSNIIKMKLGGVHDCKGSQNSAEIEGIARFAVQEHNKKEVLFFPYIYIFQHYLG